MLKVKSKKKTQKGSTTTKPQPVTKKPAPKPEWNSSLSSDPNQYKLTPAELVRFLFLNNPKKQIGSKKSSIDVKA